MPFALDLEGGFSLGLKIGRRSSDLALLDFTGAVCGTIHEPHPYPVPARLLEFASRGIAALTGGPRRDRQALRLAGLLQ